MSKYRKKPVVIEAKQLDGVDDHGVYMWIAEQTASYDYTSMVKPNIGVTINPANGRMVIRTLEGDQLVDPGDWIIKGMRGEFYPCKPEIFAATYEEVVEVEACSVTPESEQRTVTEVDVEIALFAIGAWGFDQDDAVADACDLVDRLEVKGFVIAKPPASRPLRVETYGSAWPPITGEVLEFRWRAVHTSNGEVMASGEGYADKRDRDHAVTVLFPGVEIVEVEA